MNKFFETFNIAKLESHYCTLGANNTCPIHNIPKNCNKCDKWQTGVHYFYPKIILSQYMTLLKIAMRYGCIFGHNLGGKYYCYDNDEPQTFKPIHTDNLEDCILLACIAVKENCYEDVRKVFGFVEE